MPIGRAFSSPNILFLSTWERPERAWLVAALRKLLAAGYTHFAEPCARSFTTALMAREAGFAAANIVASDVGLFSAICGTLYAGGDFAALDVRLDGVPIELPTNALDAAARLLFIQAHARTEAKPGRVYWRSLVRDLDARQAAHEDRIRSALQDHDRRLHGLSYLSEDVFTHVDRLRDQAGLVVGLNPPSYKRGYEKFFDTKGRLTWAEPPYRIYEGASENAAVLSRFTDAPALLILQELVAYRHPSGTPVYARQAQRGMATYLVSNRPDEVRRVAGFRAHQRKLEQYAPLSAPVLGPDYPITAQSVIAVERTTPSAAGFYRDLWMHKLDGSRGGTHLVVYVDGRVAGIFGLQLHGMMSGVIASLRRAGLLMYACTPPHRWRLQRLIVRLALARGTLRVGYPPRFAELPEKLYTVHLTPHPETKGLRGLMRLTNRSRDRLYGYRLTYEAPVHEDTPQQILQNWLADEERYRRARGSLDAEPVAVR